MRRAVFSLALDALSHAAPRPHMPAGWAGPQVRGAYVEKVGAKMLDLFRSYWAAMERLEVRHGSGEARQNPLLSRQARQDAAYLQFCNL